MCISLSCLLSIYTHLHPMQRLQLFFLSCIGLNLTGVSFVKSQVATFCMKPAINTRVGIWQHLLGK